MLQAGTLEGMPNFGAGIYIQRVGQALFSEQDRFGVCGLGHAVRIYEQTVARMKLKLVLLESHAFHRRHGG